MFHIDIKWPNMSTIFDNHGSTTVSSNQIVHKDQEKLSHRTRKRIREAKKKARPGKLNIKLKASPEFKEYSESINGK